MGGNSQAVTPTTPTMLSHWLGAARKERDLDPKIIVVLVLQLEAVGQVQFSQLISSFLKGGPSWLPYLATIPYPMSSVTEWRTWGLSDCKIWFFSICHGSYWSTHLYIHPSTQWPIHPSNGCSDLFQLSKTRCIHATIHSPSHVLSFFNLFYQFPLPIYPTIHPSINSTIHLPIDSIQLINHLY